MNRSDYLPTVLNVTFTRLIYSLSLIQFCLHTYTCIVVNTSFPPVFLSIFGFVLFFVYLVSIAIHFDSFDIDLKPKKKK